MASSRPHSYQPNAGYLPNGASPVAGGATNLLPNQGRVVQAGGARILCVADVRGNLRSLNELAKQARADHIIHTGDFGFYDESSLERIADKTLKHVAQYSPLLSDHVKKAIASAPPQPPVKSLFNPQDLPLSELSQFLDKTYSLEVPVYTVWGACEDVRVLEKFRSGEYKVDKLHIIDEANSRLLDVGGVKLRVLGLGGAVVMHKLFDNGEGRTTIAGGQGTMWTTLLQMGELVDTANRVYDPTETRLFVTHASPAREGLLNQLSVSLKADFSVSAGLHFRYGSSYNEFSVNPTLDHYRGKLAASKASFNDVWETVKSEVEPVVKENEAQNALLQNALGIVQKMPNVANGGNPFGGPVNGPHAGGQVDESAFKNMWNFNLADAAFGWLVLDIDGGRIGTEMRAQGFNFAHRGGKPGASQPAQAVSSTASPSIQGGPTQQPRGPAPVAPAAPVPPHLRTSQAKAAGVTRTPQQPGAEKAPAPAASNGPSPAPAGPGQQIKPATPQPATTTVNLPSSTATEPSAPAAASTNGNSEKAAPSPVNKPGTPPTDRKQVFAIFLRNGPTTSTEEAVKELFPDEDKTKIQKIAAFGPASWAVHFSSAEEVDDVLKRQPLEVKKGFPNMKIFEERPNKRNFTGPGRGGAGRWQGSNQAGEGHQGGYKSGGERTVTSDSETGRGGGNRARGAFRGRGDRGGRARGGGRGGFQKSGAGGDNTSAAPSPAPAAPSTAEK